MLESESCHLRLEDLVAASPKVNTQNSSTLRLLIEHYLP